MKPKTLPQKCLKKKVISTIDHEKKENKYIFSVAPINRYGKISNKEKIKIIGVSFKSKNDALKWFKENAGLVAKSTYSQFKDELDYISGFAIHLFRDTKVIRTFIMKENKKY